MHIFQTEEQAQTYVQYSHATTKPSQVVVWLLTLDYAGERQRIEFRDLKQQHAYVREIWAQTVPF